MKRRRVATLATLAALVAVAATVALRWVGASPIERTVALGQGQYVRVVAVDARTGHVYITLYDSSHDKTRVVDAAGTRWRTLATVPHASLSLAVASHTGRVFLLRPSTNGQETRVDVLDASRETTLRTTTVPLYPSYATNAVDVRGGVVALVSPGNQNCTDTGTGAPTCTLSGSGVALLDAATGRLRRVLAVPGQAWTVGVDAHTAHVLVTSATGPCCSLTRPIVSVFDPATGRLLHRTALAPPNPLGSRRAVDAATGRAFLLAAGGPGFSQPFRSTLYVLDISTGALVRTLTWSGGPGDVAVDERTGRVFVTDTGRIASSRRWWQEAASAHSCRSGGVPLICWTPARARPS